MSIFNVKPVLILNADMMPVVEPINTLSYKHAINRIINNRVDVVYTYNKAIGTKNPVEAAKIGLASWPSVIVSKAFIKRKFAGDTPPWSIQTLYIRDGLRCRYCKEHIPSYREATIDHYVPKDLGGPNNWENVVLACGPCNQRKANNPPTGEWRLDKAGHIPTYYEIAHKSRRLPLTIPDERWIQFLGDWKAPISVNPDLARLGKIEE